MSAGSGWLIEDLPAEVPRRRRRPGGHWGLVIVLAVLLAVAVAAGLRPRQLGGSGDMRVSLVLPAPGECLRWDADTTAAPAVIVAHPELPLPVVAGSLASTSCTTPHQGQVVQAWRQVAVDDQRAQRRCVDAGQFANEYFQEVSASGWSAINGERRATMVRIGVAPTDWVACVLIEIPRDLPPAVFTLSGPLSRDTSAGPRWCLDDEERSVGCDRPHRFERIGVADVPRGIPSCTEFAQARIGSPVPFGEPGLTIRTGTLTGTFARIWFCDVVAPEGRNLTASVVGLGTGALPVA